jgi:hypothetical protein
MPVFMVRLLAAAEHREDTATRREVNWTKVQGGIVRRRRAGGSAARHPKRCPLSPSSLDAARAT